MTRGKPKNPVTPKRKLGVLVCDTCRRAIPYQGTSDPADNWPQHKCADLEVRPFNRFLDEDPYRPPLPKANSGLYPEGWV
jgi:hypothetical protein